MGFVFLVLSRIFKVGTDINTFLFYYKNTYFVEEKKEIVKQ